VESLRRPDGFSDPSYFSEQTGLLSPIALPNGPAPHLGEHTLQELEAAGYEAGDATILRERGVA